MAARRKGSTRQGDLFGPAPDEIAPPLAREPVKRRRSRPRADASLDAGARFEVGVQVVVPAATGSLSYGWPRNLGTPLVGSRVAVPVRGRVQVGVIWQVAAVAELDCPVERLRPVASLLDPEALWSAAMLTTLEAMAQRWVVPLGMAVRTALPAPLRRTGIAEDREAARHEQIAEAVEGAVWPDELRKGERRVLDRLAAAGEVPVRLLRKVNDPLTGISKSVSVPQKMLDQLAERGLLKLSQRRVLRDPLGLRAAVERDEPPLPTLEQAAALDVLLPALRAGQGRGYLLRGVTGSGKTEIYLRLIADALAPTDERQPGGAIVLVPEIALTPQLVSRFRARFGDRVAVLHSAMSEGERYDQYTRVRSGAAPIVIGPRSALFAPMANLRVIVLDECHDPSFKQQTGVRYHARDVALMLARRAGAICILGSATPGCEDIALAERGELARIDLFKRVSGRPLPEARCIDLRQAQRATDPESEVPSLLSMELIEAVANTVRRGEQAMILHNRRGFATSLVCRGCGAAVECTECAVSLTLHRRAHRLRCHWCGKSEPIEQSCQKCGSSNLLAVGSGTERLEQTLAAHVPGIRVARFDRDTATGKRMLQTLDAFRTRKLDVLVGTQMLAKGHDFPAVTLVGIALAEQGLRQPDFRAAERTFQLLTQVAGRAGRGERPGQVLVQTLAPQHPAIVAALGHDHTGFVATEMASRRRTGYPPFSHLALIETRGKQANDALVALRRISDALRRQGEVDVRGPLPAGVSRVRGIFRFHTLLRSERRPALERALELLQRDLLPKVPSSIRGTVDVDPTEFA